MSAADIYFLLVQTVILRCELLSSTVSAMQVGKLPVASFYSLPFKATDGKPYTECTPIWTFKFTLSYISSESSGITAGDLAVTSLTDCHV